MSLTKRVGEIGRTWGVVAGALLAVVLTAGPSGAATTGQAAGTTWGSTGRIWVKGDSTLHKWSAQATSFQARMTVPEGDKAQAPVALAREGKVKGMELILPVTKLSSGDSGLDHNMYKTLKSSKFPTIRFQMNSYKVLPGTKPGVAFLARATGDLTIAGVTRPVTLDLDGKSAKGGLYLTGAKALRMSDFGIKPPTFFLGTLKVADDVTVGFGLQVQEHGPATPHS